MYVIGGANGFEKSTLDVQILPYCLEVFKYVNADKI